MQASKPVHKARPTGWAILGASTIAREFMVDAIRATGGQVLWIVSGSADRAAEFARVCRIERHTTDMAEALSDEQVQAVYVGSANSRHREQVMAAARAGKHVLCDKPLASRSADAIEMAQACDRAEVVLAVNHHLRSSHVHKAMHRLIAQGEIGDVRSLLIVHAGWLRPELQTWRLTDPREGAIYLDLSVHDVDLARYLLNQEPMTAIGVGSTVALGGEGVHDHAMYALIMSAGTFVQAHESFVTPHVESQVLVLGSKGSMLALGTLGQRAAGTLHLRRADQAEEVCLEPIDLYQDTIQHFLAAVRSGERPLASGWDGLVSLRAAEAIAIASAQGRSVSI